MLSKIRRPRSFRPEFEQLESRQLLALVVTAPAAQIATPGTPLTANLGSFTDTGTGPWSASVAWGDGSANTTFNLATMGSLGTQVHTYAAAGVYVPKVTVTDSTTPTPLTGFATFTVATYTTSVTLDSSKNLVITDVAQGGQNDSLTVQATATNYNIIDPNHILGIISITGASLSSDGHVANVPFTAVTGTQITVSAGAGNDSFTIDPSLGPIPKPVSYDGGAGTDSLICISGDHTWNLTGANAGSISGLVTFSNVENLTGGSGRDVFHFGGSGSVVGAINGGAGSNWLDYSALSSVAVNLTTGIAARTGSVLNVNNIIGSANGGDTLTGSAAGGILVGHGTGNGIVAGAARSILIGGYGINTIVGGAADDLIINGRTTYDSNFATLESILGVWQGAQTFSQRIAALQAVGPNQLKIGTTVFINPGKSATIGPHYGRGNGVYQSSLVGNGGSNWFITNLLITVLDHKTGDVVTVS